MISFTLSELLQSLSSLILNLEQLPNLTSNQTLVVNNIQLDTRKVTKNDIFVAIDGDSSDGHDYLQVLSSNDCLLAIVEKLNNQCSVPQLLVNSTREAIGLLTTSLQAKWHKPVVTITGSCGKTTTKFMLNAMLKTKGETLCAQASFNNDLGVPLTMFSANERQWAGVFEMGTNHPGEIGYLSGLISSNIAILTNVSSGHIGNFPDEQSILKEKSDIFNNMQSDAIAILPYELADTQTVVDKLSEQSLSNSVLTFGLQPSADVYADCVTIAADRTSFNINYDGQAIAIDMKLLGMHQVLNALAASCAAIKLGVSFKDIKCGLESIEPVAKRMQPVRLSHNICIIDDSYNANPASVTAAIDYLAELKGTKVVVLGSLAELGDYAKDAHSRIGLYAKEKNIDNLFALGDDTKYTLSAFNEQQGCHFNRKQDLITDLLDYLSNYSNSLEPCTILIKGSNNMKMWEITEYLKQSLSLMENSRV